MYKPAPVRRTKTNISRSRDGCQQCRQKRSKCDERKPSCSTCVRLERTCEYHQPSYHFRTVTLSSNEHPSAIERPSKSRTRSRSNNWAATESSRDRAEIINSTVPIVPRDENVGQEWLATNPLSTNWPHPYSPGSSLQLGGCSWGVNGSHGAFLRDHTLENKGGQSELYSHTDLDFYLSASRLHFERDFLYVTHWEKSCLPALGPIFTQLSTHLELSPVLRDAILALSACNMSRIHPELNKSDILRDLNLTHRPHLTHHMHSQMYYSSAIRRLARLSSVQYRHSFLSILAAMLLFCYLESSICNFRGHSCHMDGISSLLAIDLESIRTNTSGSGLLVAWEQSKYYNWWIRIHFSTLEFQKSQSALQTSLHNHDIGSKSARRAVLLSILCESYRLSSKAFIQWWNCQGLLLGSTGSHPNSYDHEEDYKLLLLRESKRLDRWESELQPSELPTRPFSLETRVIRRSPDTHSTLEPLLFPSHEASTNYAYYAATRIMQCSWITHELKSNTTVNHDFDATEENYWTMLLLRVVYGIKKSDCVRQNVYTIGISGLLLACVLRSTSLAAGLYIETWLKEFQRAQVFEEGSLPVSQIIAIVGTINHQRQAGYDIFAISPIIEDDGGNGKFDSYNNQCLSDVLVFGRYRQTGCAFSKCVSVKNNTEGVKIDD